MLSQKFYKNHNFPLGMTVGTVLLTGVAGFIGSHTAEGLLKKGYKVIGVDNFLTGKKENVEELRCENFYFIEADINNLNQTRKIFNKHRIDYIFHYAAVVGVQRTLKNPLLVLDDIEGIDNLCKLSVKNNVKRVFFSSSSEVYGDSVFFPQKEAETPLNSRLPYAVVKNVSEVKLKAYHDVHGLDCTIFRFFNTYGPRQSRDFVLSKFIDQALSNENITIYGDGRQTRTFCYIDDNVKFTTACLELPSTKNEIYNVGTEKEINIAELAELVKKITNSNSEVVFLEPLKEGDMKRRVPSVQKMLDVFPFEFTSLEKGVKETIKYWQRKKQYAS